MTIRGVEHCPTFAMAALAGIGALPDTITDRAVVVAMRRRAPGEDVARYRERRDGDPLKELGGHLGTWVRAHLDELREAEPDMPVEDRAADSWEPLIAIADLAGGDWPARARKAATALTAEDDTDTSLGARLLADLRDVFGDADKLMHRDDPGRAAQDQRGTVGRLLRSPAERPRSGPAPQALPRLLYRREDRRGQEGYRREHLHDPFIRYLPPEPGGSATSATSATAQVSDAGGRGS